MEEISRVGDVLKDKYVLEELLGAGGMGEVYRARNKLVDRTVAIKVLHPELASNKQVVERFMREAKAANVVRHKNIVDVLDIDKDETGAMFIVQEYLDGEDLAERLEGLDYGRMPWKETLDILIPVADAVGEAHARGVVHRDLKPDNVFLAMVDGEMVPKVLDFGISKLPVGPEPKRITVGAGSGAVSGRRAARLTAAGSAMGTPAYMSPEQIKDPASVDAHTDVWALGVIIYEALTGELPFDAENLAGLFAQICTQEAKPIEKIVKGVPAGLTRVVRRCLRVDQSARIANATELNKALVQCRDQIGMPTQVGHSASPISSKAPPTSAPPIEEPEIGTLEPAAAPELEFADTLPPAARRSGRPPEEPRSPRHSNPNMAKPTDWELELPGAGPSAPPSRPSGPGSRAPRSSRPSLPAQRRVSGAIPAAPSSGAGLGGLLGFDDDDDAPLALELNDDMAPAPTPSRSGGQRPAAASKIGGGGGSKPAAAADAPRARESIPSQREPRASLHFRRRDVAQRTLSWDMLRMTLAAIVVVAVAVLTRHASPQGIAVVQDTLGVRAFMPYMLASLALLAASVWTVVRAARLVSFPLFLAALACLMLGASAAVSGSLLGAPGLVPNVLRKVLLLSPPWSGVALVLGFCGHAFMRGRELRSAEEGSVFGLVLMVLAFVGLGPVLWILQTPKPTVAEISELQLIPAEVRALRKADHLGVLLVGVRAVRSGQTPDITPAAHGGAGAGSAINMTSSEE